MIEASKAAELSSQPTKRARRAWLIGLAVVVAVVTLALLAIAPKNEPVKVWFVRSTNELGVKKLVFEGTNGIPRAFEFSACIITGAIPHLMIETGINSPYTWTHTDVDDGASFDFTLKAPPQDIPYAVVWWFLVPKHPPTRWEGLRWRCFRFFYEHRMRRLARRFEPTAEKHYIPSTEIKE